MVKHYVNAVVSLLQGGGELDAVLKNLNELLVKKGHQKLHKAILEGVCERLEVDEALNVPTVSLANAKEEDNLELQIKQALAELGYTNKNWRVQLDPTLIGGFVATYKGKRVNASYKGKLLSLYRNITA